MFGDVFFATFVTVMLEKTRGIVLHTLRYGESSLVVDIFTEQRGTVSFLVRMPRSRKSPIRTVLLRPLTILEIDFDFRPSKSLQHIKDMRVCVPYTSIPYVPIKETIALFLSEFLYYVLRHESANPSLFDYLATALEWFDQVEDGYANFHLALLIHISRFLGFWPYSEDWYPGALFDLVEGHYVSTPPVHGAYLPAEESRMLGKYLRMDYTNMRRFHLNRALRRYVLDVLTRFYRLHVAEFPEVKSLAVLREMFD